MKSGLVLLGVWLLVAGGDDDTAENKPAAPAPPPDAGTQAGHVADPGRVAVPERDPSPPAASISLTRADGTLAEASLCDGARTVTLNEPALRGTTIAAVHGELWGEAINGSGLEAVTPHLKFVYEAG